MKELKLEIDYAHKICNMNCSYCIVDKRHIKTANIDYVNICRYVHNYIVIHNASAVELRFTACEPMLILDDIIKLITYIRSIGRPINISLVVVTNATLYNSEIENKIATIKKLIHKFSLIVSIDTLEEYQPHRLIDSRPAYTKDLLSNMVKYESFMNTKATISAVIKEQTIEQIHDLINYANLTGRKLLLSPDISNNNLNKETLDIISYYRERCNAACLLSKDRLCIDTTGAIYLCRSQSTANIKSNYNVLDNIYDLIFDFTDIYNKTKNTSECPFLTSSK